MTFGLKMHVPEIVDFGSVSDCSLMVVILYQRCLDLKLVSLWMYKNVTDIKKKEKQHFHAFMLYYGKIQTQTS